MQYAIRDLCNARAELQRWIRRAREGDRKIAEMAEVHTTELAEREEEIARLRAELKKLKKAKGGFKDAA